ncbi:hypothetical protein ACIA8O_31560 [Kitasatospora sp. NPDC051853]|uniref:hypothetical protein n=1 Tax=Kitasatospora sp. NPDC051853 TaxID=3364058 RepID=UPI00378DC0B5
MNTRARRTSARLIAVLAGAGLVATLAGTQSASAVSKYNECSKSTGVLSIGTEYDHASQNTVYVKEVSFTIERNGNAHNNVYLRVRKGSGTDVYAWTSGDDVRGGQTKSLRVNKRISKTDKPYFKGNATFDSRGRDESCSAYITY